AKENFFERHPARAGGQRTVARKVRGLGKSVGKSSDALAGMRELPGRNRPRKRVEERAGTAVRALQDAVAREPRGAPQLLLVDRRQELDLGRGETESSNIVAQECFAERALEKQAVKRSVDAHALGPPTSRWRRRSKPAIAADASSPSLSKTGS